MKREILCSTCTVKLKKLFPTSNPHPGEYIKFVSGKAKKDFNCDDCNAKISKGQDCTAMSIWSDHGGYFYYQWEHQYLKTKEKGA